MKLYSFILALSAACLAQTSLAQTSMTRPLTAPVNRDLATATQDIVLAGDMVINISVAPLTTSGNGFGLGKLSTKVSGSPFGMMPRINVANPTSQDAALAAAKDWVSGNIGKFRTDYSSWMRARGLSMGFYNYSQEIMVETEEGPKKKAIAFNAAIDINGRPTYGDPKIVDPNPTIVEATYTPLRAAEGLPTSWKYPDAGKIRWRLLNKKYEPLTGWRLEDTGGAFDLVDANSNASAAAACLIDRKHPGCAGPTDVRKLMDKTGAMLALVNYIHTLQPVYEGEDEQTPKAAISVDERTWNCSTYRNKGSFGFVLALQADQYVAEYAAGPLPHQLVHQFGGKGISPTEPYEKEVPVATLAGQHPDGLIINPLPDANDLLKVTDPSIAGSLIYVAPVAATGGDGLLNDALFSGDMDVRLIGGSDTTKEYYIGTVGNDYWPTGVYDRTVRFNLANPETTEKFHMLGAGFDDHMLVAVNGTIVYIGANGGNMLEYMGAGTSETDCTASGSGWSCKSASTYVQAPTKSGGEDVCPSPLLLTNGAQGTGCYKVEGRPYDYCSVSSSTTDANDTVSYTCTQGCAPYWVQHLQGAKGTGSGCLPLERETSWNIPTNIDLRPYLKDGDNEIFMRTIVGGDGEGWIKVQTAMCGSNLGLGRDIPPVPAGAGEQGVTDTLGDLSGK